MKSLHPITFLIPQNKICFSRSKYPFIHAPSYEEFPLVTDCQIKIYRNMMENVFWIKKYSNFCHSTSYKEMRFF